MTPQELWKLHKLHCWTRSVQYNVILERLADGWSEKDIIQKSKRKSWIKYSNRINENLPRNKPMRQHLIYHIKFENHLYDYVEQDKEWLVKYMIREDWETEYKEWKYIAWSKFLKWWTWTVNWTHIVAKDKKGKVRFETWKETSPQEEPKTDEDKRQRYNDSNFDNMVDAIADGKVSFTDWNDALSKIKEKYRVSGKMEQQILSYFK